MNTFSRYLLVLGALAFLCTACVSRSDYPRLLVAADSLLEVRPDSAWSILQSISRKNLNTERERMFYDVMDAEARMLNGIFSVDSLPLKTAIRHFRQTGNAALLARACYGLGLLHSHGQDYDAALVDYRQAAGHAGQVRNWRLLGRIYNQAGYIYQFNGLIASADSLYRQAEQAAGLAADTLLLAEVVYRQGMCLLHAGKEKYPDAERRMLEAYRLATGRQRGSIAMSLSHLYSLCRAYEMALRYAQEAACLLQGDTARLCRVHVMAGDAYYKMGQYDSARHYFSQSLLSDAPEVKASAYMRLADIAGKRQEWKEAAGYRELESRYRQFSHEQSRKTDILLSQKNTEIGKARELVRQYKNGLLLGGTALLSGGIGCLVWYWRKRHAGGRKTNGQGQGTAEKGSLPSGLSDARRGEQSVPGWGKEDFDYFAKAIRETGIFHQLKTVIDCRKEKPYKEGQETWEPSDRACLLAEVKRLLPGYLDSLRACCPLLDDEDIFILSLLLTDLPITHIALLQKKSRTRDGLYKRLYKLQKEKMSHLEGKEIKKQLYSIPKAQKSV